MFEIMEYNKIIKQKEIMKINCKTKLLLKKKYK